MNSRMSAIAWLSESIAASTRRAASPGSLLTSCGTSSSDRLTP
jgi:hypothetical protein